MSIHQARLSLLENLYRSENHEAGDDIAFVDMKSWAESEKASDAFKELFEKTVARYQEKQVAR